jgi:hypothetical protein
VEGRQGVTRDRINRRTCLGVLAAPIVGTHAARVAAAPTHGTARRPVRQAGPAASSAQAPHAFPTTTPRLLFTRAELSRMRARASHPRLARLRDAVIARAMTTLAATPLVPSITMRGQPDPPGEDKGLSCARALQGRVFTLGMAWELTGEHHYLEHAIVQLEQAVRDWRIWVDTAHAPPFDLMTGELSLTFGIAIDWLLDAVAPARRAAIVDGVVERGLKAYLAAVERPSPPGWHTAENNWNPVCNGGAAVLALALQGPFAERPRSESGAPERAGNAAVDSTSALGNTIARVLGRAVPAIDRYWDHLADDGGWDEGTGYWRYGHRYALMTAEALRRCGNPSGDAVFARPGVRQTGYFPLVFNPGTRLAAGFGDSNNRAYDPIFYFLGARYRDAAFIWYQDRAPIDTERVGWPDAALSLIWRPVDEPWLPENTPHYVPHLPSAAVFAGIGWALLAPSQPDPPHFLSFKNGSLAANHTHLDLNHVSVGVGDEMLLVELGNRPYPADYFHAGRRYGYYEIGTRGHNTVLVDGRGQVHGRKGRLLPLVEQGDIRILTGVADDAYEAATPVARRHVCTLDGGRLYVVIDQIETTATQPIELRWHTGGAWTMGPDGGAVVTSGPARGAMRVHAHAGTPAMSIAPAEGWIRPVSVLRVGCPAATRHLVATVIVPGTTEAPPLSFDWSQDGTAVQLRLGQRPIALTLGADGLRVRA